MKFLSVVLILSLLLFVFLLMSPLSSKPVLAQCAPQTTNPRVQNGLISTPTLSTNFSGPDAKCVTTNKASFVPYKMPTFAKIISDYFDQSKLAPNLKITLNGNQTQTTATTPISLSLP